LLQQARRESNCASVKVAGRFGGEGEHEMTTSSMDVREPEDLVRLWAEEMTQVMGGDNGSSTNAWSILNEAPPDTSAQSDSEVWILAALSGTLRGEMAFRLPAGLVVRVAQIFMGAPGEPTQLTPEHNDALLELFRQAGGLTATAIKPARGDVRFQIDLMPAPPTWPPSLMAWLRFGQDTIENSMQLLLSAALVAAFRGETQETALSGVPHPGAAPVQTNEAKLDLLMDVDLGVTLRFGSRRLLLREVLELCPGSVIALDRQVEDPVDMLLDGRVIARGEVVVVEGNYGLRVTEIAWPS
jgi:flagellar motor switch protein FliN/FliY